MYFDKPQKIIYKTISIIQNIHELWKDKFLLRAIFHGTWTGICGQNSENHLQSHQTISCHHMTTSRPFFSFSFCENLSVTEPECTVYKYNWLKYHHIHGKLKIQPLRIIWRILDVCGMHDYLGGGGPILPVTRGGFPPSLATGEEDLRWVTGSHQRRNDMIRNIHPRLMSILRNNSTTNTSRSHAPLRRGHDDDKRTKWTRTPRNL